MEPEEKDMGTEEISMFFEFLLRLTEIGINNKIKPEEVVNYFISVGKEVERNTQKIFPKQIK